ncbi:hypothetical protein GN956_G10956 [Arapaima gigas]
MSHPSIPVKEDVCIAWSPDHWRTLKQHVRCTYDFLRFFLLLSCCFILKKMVFLCQTFKENIRPMLP